jgi:two-component system response regulator TtrR
MESNNNKILGFVYEHEYVYLIEDNDTVRQNIADVLRQWGYTVIEFSNALRFLSHYPALQEPGVIVMDMRMPEMTGVELQKMLQKQGCRVPIIFISGESTVEEALRAMKQGASDFLIKPFEIPALFKAVQLGIETHVKQLYADHNAKIQAEILDRLAPREKQVCELLAAGHANADIALMLGISAETIKQYKKQILNKLQVKNVAELIAQFEAGMIHSQAN